jgi:exodeoxyribonuclease VII large subunit
MPRKSTSIAADSQPSLLDAPRAGSNLPEFTVTELSRQLKRTVEETYGQVRVRGEISECKLHSSGHLYLTLKDENAILSAVRWRTMGSLGIKPEIGMEVVCTGRLTTFAGQSKYQMVVESMALAGLGALLKLLEERRQKLAAEGLFDPARKQLLPYLPEVIGVITSPTGAVIRDILHRLNDRFPCRVLIWPVAVQGDGAAEQVAAAVRGFNTLPPDGPIPKPDLLIVARGGGSVEDLMPFNEEAVVRAVADSIIPVISAVGHETDTTLIDHAADVRAPTPTAAAEMAVPVRLELMAVLERDRLRLSTILQRVLLDKKERLLLLGRALGDPSRAIEPLAQRLDERSERLALAWQSYSQTLAHRLAESGSRIRHPRDTVTLLGQKLTEQAQRLRLSWHNDLQRRTGRVAEIASRIRQPQDVMALAQQRLTHQLHRLQQAGGQRLALADRQLERLGGMLMALSPRAVLGRGYSLVYDATGRVVTQAAQLKPQDTVQLEFQDGSRAAVISHEE